MITPPRNGRPTGVSSSADGAGAVQLAASLLQASLSTMTRRERRQQRRLATVVGDASLRELTFAMTDEVLRFTDDRRAARRLRSVVAEHGVPTSMGAVDRLSLAVGARLAPRLPRVVMPMVRSRLLREANGVVLSADDPAFAEHLRHRTEQGFRLNVNVLGEAILSDAEADVRVGMLRERIGRSDVHYVSLKISAICANLDVFAFDHSLDRICDRLRMLYRDAASSHPTTFLNLDMEEYRDLHLTIAAMQRVLDEDEFAVTAAGIVLQAYLPDSHAACVELCDWALARHQRSGGTLKIRIVKGANLAMERVDAELHGLVQAPYGSKAEVDASFKRLITAALDDRYAGAVRVGVASHNLFDVAWGLSLGAGDRIDLEMLEGMAPAQSRAVLDAAGDLLLYAPVVRSDDLPASIAYLTRRLDENTSPDNFLRALFTLTPGSPEWDDQRRRFERAVADQPTIDTSSRRQQHRAAGTDVPAAGRFSNAADTDFTQSPNRDWIRRALDAFQPGDYPSIDTAEEIDRLLAVSVAAGRRWASTTTAERNSILMNAADTMEAARGETLAQMAFETAKTIPEGDPEVSEGIDFARYYAHCASTIAERSHDGTVFTPLGVVVVASPWNFPYAIPTGGVCAALAAGNAVVLKPAPEARGVAWLLVNQLWAAGVPTDVLQFVSCPDNEVGQRLMTHEDVATVVLTGAFETAARFLEWKPSMRLLAETSGKNAMVITAAADEDAAIRDLVRSAFGHAGQKCSAASLAILEAPVYDDQRFLRRLAEAVTSLRVGEAAAPETMVGPLIAAPGDKLLRALTTLDDGEHWLVEPRCLDAGQAIWSPGVRLGVQPGSWFHRNECFGPVLGVMRALDLDDAIAIQNGGDYGLTGGLQSLDEREAEHWLASVDVGNAYVNRHMTGAIVQRQPFGGWKRSSVGCGPKAGGPFYVEAFGSWSTTRAEPAASAARPVSEFSATEPSVTTTSAEFTAAWNAYFTADSDPSALACERNLLRYRSLRRVGLLIGAGVDPVDVQRLQCAARTAGVEVIDVSTVEINVTPVVEAIVATPARFEIDGVADLIGLDRVRVLGDIHDDLRRRLRRLGLDLDQSPAQPTAELELRHWVREQSISWTRHRHGRLLHP